MIYDKESLKPGHNMNFFMERAATDPNVKKILIICDKSYTKKANNRESGVGTETQLISSMVYGNPLQNKVIPVFFERDENNELFVPIYLEGVYAIDLTMRNESNYSELHDDIFS